MKLNIDKSKIEIVDKIKSPVKKREAIKGIEVIPFIDNFKYYCIIGNVKYEIIVDENYIPMYRFSTKANDKYVVNTIKQGFREIHYKNLSMYWTYLSTTIPIKVLLQGDKAFAKTSMLNFVYSTNYNSYCNEHNKRNKT